jgi:ribose/xylose/arabinose/galactoside ABC-type transport system permease subunit
MTTTSVDTTSTQAKQGSRLALGYQTFMSRHSSMMPTFAAIVILLVLFVGAEAFLRGDFITARNISALLLDNAYLLILAVGMTFVIVTAGIDLAVGSVMAFTGILLAKLIADGMNAYVAIPIILIGGALIGLLTGVLVHYFDVQPFIASLAGLFLARGLAFVVSLSSIRVDDPIIPFFQSRIRFGEWYITPTGIIAVVVVIIGAIVMQMTRFGRTVYAIGGSEQSARLMGLNVARTKVAVYVISGFCAGLAGLVLTAYSASAYPRNGIGTELDAIAAVVIGGTLLTGGRGYVLGSVVGVFVYGTINTIINFMGAEQSWTRIIVGLLLLVFILVQRFIVGRTERRT